VKYAIIGAGRQGLASAYDIGKFGGADEIVLLDSDPEAITNGIKKLNSLLRDVPITGKTLDVTSEKDLISEPFKMCASSVRRAVRAETSSWNPTLSLGISLIVVVVEEMSKG